MGAQVLSKTNLLSPANRWNGGGGSRGVHRHQCHHHQRFPVSLDLGFVNRSVKLRSLALRSSDSFCFRIPRQAGNYHQIQAVASGGAQMSFGIGKSLKWWEKGLQPNMKEVTGAQDLVDSLLNAGDKLVVVDFLSPGCGGCKALHPKICQLAEMNPDVQFLHVNHEEHKSMCYSLNVHVLPFFRFYRGAHGRVCSFSCTNATIKKFKDALAKYKPDQCSLGPPKGLEEKELVALSSNKDLSFTYTPKTEQPTDVPVRKETLTETKPALISEPNPPLPLPLPLHSKGDLNTQQDFKDKSMVSSGT